MFSEEAGWIKEALKSVNNVPHKTAGNFGSSTGYFRKHIQPHIHNFIFGPLESTGWKVQHIDIKAEEGVDVVADITAPSFSHNFAGRYSLIFCTNMLEHVTNIPLVINNLLAAAEKNAYILLTVPYKYKKHLDPIDNMFRPTPERIDELFSHVSHSVVKAGIVTIHNKEYYRVKKSAFPLWGYRERMLYYVGRRHKVSALLIQLNN
ncbi:methyltransferase domain-containing protein [Foetidibacter luteolus]|uniref:methyltransferase domain-containing protein n=1 Tax=Foetidibacter luteolus TaxID=2608880 RepID=UPI00129AB7EA|nr:methyltransferase domain-containing protein [Foetidibacter luteolus]